MTQQNLTDKIPNNAIPSEREHLTKSCRILPFHLHLAYFLMAWMKTGFKLLWYLQWQQLNFAISLHLQCCSFSSTLWCSSCMQVSPLWKWTPSWSFLMALCHHCFRYSTKKFKFKRQIIQSDIINLSILLDYQKHYKLHLRFNPLWNN